MRRTSAAGKTLVTGTTLTTKTLATETWKGIASVGTASVMRTSGAGTALVLRTLGAGTTFAVMASAMDCLGEEEHGWRVSRGYHSHQLVRAMRGSKSE